MKKIFKMSITFIIISIIFAINLPIYAFTNDNNNTVEEIYEDVVYSVSREAKPTSGSSAKPTSGSSAKPTSGSSANPTIAYARIDKNGKITIHIKNMKTQPEILINDKKVEAKAVGLYTFEVTDKSLINTTAKISLKFSKNNIVSKSFYLSAGKDFNNEMMFNNYFMNSVKNVFADNQNVYMYSPEMKMIFKLYNKPRYGCGDVSYAIMEYAIEDMIGIRGIETGEIDLKYDNTDFVIINGVIYSIFSFDVGDGKKQPVLLYIDMKTGAPDAKRLTELPNDCNLSMSTLGVYNGNLYVIGGYNENNNTISKNVYEYNINTKTWTKKADLPEERFASTANQVGDNLILSFGGKSDGKIPCNLIYDGENWRKSTAGIDVRTSTGTIGNTKYYKPSVGIVSGGLIYSGINAEQLGNVFFYDIATDSFRASGYNVNNNKNTIGVALGDKYYLINKNLDENKNILVRSIPVKSGLSELTIRYPSTGIRAWVNADNYGKRESDGNTYKTYYYMPGDIVGFKLTDIPGYYYSHFKVDDQEVNGYIYIGPIGAKKEIKITKARNLDLIRLNKISGDLSYFNTLQLTARVWDKNTTPIVWKSDDTNYATVSSTGVITPKVAGLNNSVKIIASTTLYGRDISVSSNIRIIKPVIYNKKITRVTNSSNTLYWSPVKGADGYEVFVRDYNNINKLNFYKRIKTNKITVTNLNPPYYRSFEIRAYKIINNKMYYGEMSTIS